MYLGFGWPPHPSSCPGAQFRIPGALPASAVCLGLCSQDGHVVGALALSWWPRLQEDSLLPSSSSQDESHTSFPPSRVPDPRGSPRIPQAAFLVPTDTDRQCLPLRAL